MFNLEHAITNWRRQMLAAGLKTPAPLDELEGHLREDIRALVSAGQPEVEAFDLAVSRLGSSKPLQTEFNKLEQRAGRPVTIGLRVYAGMMILTAALLSRRAGDRGWDLLLYAHVVSVTAGYCAAFFAGCFGIVYICCRRFHAHLLNRQRWLGRGVFLFTHLAAGFSLAGLLLGTLWSSLNPIVYFAGHLRDPVFHLDGTVREMTALRACIWLIASCVMQRIARVTERAIMMMSVGGNIVVGLAWFGPFILEGRISYWPLAVFLGINVFFLGIGLAPVREAAET
jgi:hypothetical protein